MEHENKEKMDFYYYFKFKKLENNFAKLWRMKSSARLAVKEWLLAMPCNRDSSDIIANACSELIENCIKYSLLTTFSSVEVYVVDNSIYVETLNQATRAQKKVLEEFMAMLNNVDNLSDLYIERLSKSMETGESQIGLLKILMETEGDLILLEQTDDIHLRLIIDLSKTP